MPAPPGQRASTASVAAIPPAATELVQMGPVSPPAPPPQNAIVNAINQAIPSGVTSNVVGLAAAGGTNLASAQLPGGTAAILISPFLNLLAQHVKHPKWFNENSMLMPLMFFAAAILGYAVWKSGIVGDGGGDFQVGVRTFLTAAQSTWQAMFNYHSLKLTDINIMKPVAVENAH